MYKFPFEEINLEATGKDCFSALLVWIVLAGFSFILLPGFDLIEAKNKQSAWFSASAPPGVIGSILVGTCSELIRLCQEHYQGGAKRTLIWLGMLVGWLGLDRSNLSSYHRWSRVMAIISELLNHQGLSSG